ncbi:MAG: UDP-N-acetylmuramoyl-L-alanine--D-glutamate ligase [Roseburia sp.]|nr:UDP-N-acetylmuramoyl-L-alanine--D-glutamate ligase [Roseburia sp.]MCM1099325.1 UDP-N-acetylmuramoyl-L-alanine--D-glutamate ligase [Ruminococcus flavefaciens]
MTEKTDKRNQEKYLVVGSGISGVGSAVLLERLGKQVTLYDGDESLTPERMREKLPAESRIRCIAGELPEETASSVGTVVLSPGVPVDIPLVEGLRGKGVEIIGEIELGCRREKGRIAAITGTNGKTTTTTLVGEIMKAWLGKERVFVVGNIGNPYTEECLKTTERTVTVGEISSFQLETIREFHPAVSAILNITPDHLNRHHTMEAYVQAKENITRNQTKEDVCVLNYDNSYTRAFGERCPARVIYFSTKEELAEGYWLKGDKILRSAAGESRELLDIRKDMRLVGMCNVENVMAAAAIAEALGAPEETVLSVIRKFRAVEHRIEYVATRGGVDYYNDSKGTNPDAAIQGIRAMSRPTILIGGGYDKQSEYDEWIESFEGRVKWLVLIGQTREKIAECARRHGFERIRFADTFEECLRLCTALAEEGDAVLLSPACASWGMFPNYEVRGRIFKDYVMSLGSV